MDEKKNDSMRCILPQVILLREKIFPVFILSESLPCLAAGRHCQDAPKRPERLWIHAMCDWATGLTVPAHGLYLLGAYTEVAHVEDVLRRAGPVGAFWHTLLATLPDYFPTCHLRTRNLRSAQKL